MSKVTVYTAEDDTVYTHPAHMYTKGWTTKENGVTEGGTRVIDEVLSVAWKVYKHWWPKNNRVFWTPLKIKEIEYLQKPVDYVGYHCRDHAAINELNAKIFRILNTAGLTDEGITDETTKD